MYTPAPHAIAEAQGVSPHSGHTDTHLSDHGSMIGVECCAACLLVNTCPDMDSVTNEALVTVSCQS